MPLTPTARLLLAKPDPDPVTGDFVDVSVFNGWADKIDAAISATVCTASTRPVGADRWDGRIIRETDTRRLLVWNAVQATWDPLNGPFLAASGSRPASPFVNMVIRETDTRKTLIWNSTEGVWDYVGDGLTICTSGTRPASPYVGQLIRETDTRRIYVRTPAPAWEKIVDLTYDEGNLHRTMDACRVTTAGAFQTTSTDPSEIVKLRSASISVVNGVLYRFTGQFLYTSPVDGWAVEIHKNSTAGTIVGGFRLEPSAIGANACWSVDWPCTANETLQFYYVANRLSGTGTLTMFATQDGFNGAFANIDQIGANTVLRDVP